MDFLKLLNTLSTIDNKTKLVEGKEPSPWKPGATKSSSMFKPWVAESEEAVCKGCKKPESKCACEEEKVDESADKLKEAKCNECGMWESKCSCDSAKDEIEEMMQLAGRPVKEAKKVKEDDVEEGGAFGKAVVDAKKDGVQPGETITVGGKKYPVKENTSADLMKRWADIFETEDDKLAKKDYDDDGKLETGKEEHAGSVDNAIKKSQGKDDKETVEEVKMADLPSRTVKGKSYGNQDDYEKPPADARRPAKTMPLKKDKKPLGESMDECMDGSEGNMDDNFSINSSMDSSGHKSVSITANGSKADELTNILRNAGLGVMGGGEEEQHVEIGHDDMDHGDMGSEGDVEVVSVPLAHHDGYQAPEHEEDEVDETTALQRLNGVGGPRAAQNLPMPQQAKPAGQTGVAEEDYSNEPHTQTQSVKSQMNQGNDLNAKKDMHKHSYRQGDNPMAMEEQQSVARLEKELMEELSALKVVSEKYMGFAKTAKAVGSPALAASIGRKKYGKEKFQKAAATGKKLG